MSILLIIVILILIFGIGGSGVVWRNRGPVAGGGSLGTVLIILLIVYLLTNGRF